MRGPVPTESVEQRLLAQWLDGIGVCWAHPPNEGRRHPIVGARLKRCGLKPGLPDVLIFTPPPGSPDARGATIELKRVGGPGPTALQKQWLEALRSCGWETACCKGADKAIAWLKSLGYQ